MEKIREWLIYQRIVRARRRADRRALRRERAARRLEHGARRFEHSGDTVDMGFSNIWNNERGDHR